MKKPSNLLNAKIPLPFDDTALAAIMIYLVISVCVLFEYSSLLGIALLANAVVSLVVGMVARSMGKKEGAVILLGLILGPLGGLAGLIAAPQTVEK